METRRRWAMAAGAVLAVTGAFLLVYTVVGLAPSVSNLGAGDEHLAGDAMMTMVFFGPMLAIVVLFTLGCAWLLWRGWRGATALAFVWIVAAGLYCWTMLTGFSNVLWAVRAVVLEPSRLLVHWPYLYWDPFLGTDVSGTPVENLPYGRLDDVAFWLPGIVAVGALLVVCFLLAGWATGLVRGARPSAS